MFKFIKQIFVSTMMFFAWLSSMKPLECVSVNNQECKIRPEIVNVNSNEPLLYPFSIKTSKCNGICNNINSPHAKLCVPDVVKNLNIKVFNLMSGTNETINIQLFVTINSAGMKINVGVCEKVIDIGVCNKGFI